MEFLPSPSSKGEGRGGLWVRFITEIPACKSTDETPGAGKRGGRRGGDTAV